MSIPEHDNSNTNTDYNIERASDLYLPVPTIPPFRRTSRLAILRRLTWRCHVLAITAMGYMAKLHYACRYLSLLIDRLKSLRLVKVECSLVCCYVVDVRVVYTHSTPPRNKLRHTVHLRIRSPITLRRTMKPSKLAACSANEILRRQTQIDFDGAVLSQFDLEQRAALMSMFFKDNPTHVSDLGQRGSTMGFQTECPTLSKKRKDGSAEDAVSSRRHSLSSGMYCFMFK